MRKKPTIRATARFQPNWSERLPKAPPTKERSVLSRSRSFFMRHLSFRLILFQECFENADPALHFGDPLGDSTELSTIFRRQIRLQRPVAHDSESFDPKTSDHSGQRNNQSGHGFTGSCQHKNNEFLQPENRTVPKEVLSGLSRRHQLLRHGGSQIVEFSFDLFRSFEIHELFLEPRPFTQVHHIRLCLHPVDLLLKMLKSSNGQMGIRFTNLLLCLGALARLEMPLS